MPEPESLGKIMSHGHLPAPRGKKLQLELVGQNWRHIAGERLAPHGIPTRFSRGTLTVSAEGPSWAAELCTATPTLLSRIGGLLGDDSVQKIRVQARNWVTAERGGAAGSRIMDAGDGASLEAQVRNKLEGIEEEETRGALERMLRASIASRQTKQGR